MGLEGPTNPKNIIKTPDELAPVKGAAPITSSEATAKTQKVGSPVDTIRPVKEGESKMIIPATNISTDPEKPLLTPPSELDPEFEKIAGEAIKQNPWLQSSPLVAYFNAMATMLSLMIEIQQVNARYVQEQRDNTFKIGVASAKEQELSMKLQALQTKLEGFHQIASATIDVGALARAAATSSDAYKVVKEKEAELNQDVEDVKKKIALEYMQVDPDWKVEKGNIIDPKINDPNNPDKIVVLQDNPKDRMDQFLANAQVEGNPEANLVEGDKRYIEAQGKLDRAKEFEIKIVSEKRQEIDNIKGIQKSIVEKFVKAMFDFGQSGLKVKQAEVDADKAMLDQLQRLRESESQQFKEFADSLKQDQQSYLRTVVEILQSTSKIAYWAPRS